MGRGRPRDATAVKHTCRVGMAAQGVTEVLQVHQAWKGFAFGIHGAPVGYTGAISAATGALRSVEQGGGEWGAPPMGAVEAMALAEAALWEA